MGLSGDLSAVDGDEDSMVESAETIRFEGLSVTGVSRAGVETWFRVRPPDVAFDVGRGSPRLEGVDRVFLTHGHLDHVAGLPYLLSQRSLAGAGSTTIYCPSATLEPLEASIRAAQDLERRRYEYRLVALGSGDRVEVGPDLAVLAFAADHVVPALGYHLVQTVERLCDDLASESGDRIAALRRSGEVVTRSEQRHLLSYPGDTAASIFESEPRVFEAEILLLECTFIGARGRSTAASFGHVHLEDLSRHQSEFANRWIVLHHLSRRHSLAELRREIERCLPGIADRVKILGEGEMNDE